MNTVKILEILLILVGGLWLVYGSYSYPKKIHKAELGQIAVVVKDKPAVHFPIWASVAIIIASALLLFGGKRS